MYRLLGLIIILTVVSGCAYQQAVQNLEADEQNAFRAYSKVINGSQARTYLAKSTAAERSAYLREIGAQQRFDALAPKDREAILKGYIRKGMSADALHFLWGNPQYTTGNTGKWEYWVYRGQIPDLLTSGNRYSDGGSEVRVHLVDGQVEWWLEGVPDTHDDPGDGVDRIRR